MQNENWPCLLVLIVANNDLIVKPYCGKAKLCLPLQHLSVYRAFSWPCRKTVYCFVLVSNQNIVCLIKEKYLLSYTPPPPPLSPSGASAGTLEQSLGARNRVGIGLSYRPATARTCKHFKEPRNLFPAWRPGVTNLFDVPARQVTRNRILGIDSWAP